MLLYLLLLAGVLFAAGASLLASKDTRQDLATGRPTFDSIADATGIWNRSQLDTLVGPRDSDDRYTASAEKVRSLPKNWWKRWFDNDFADVGCITLSLASLSVIRVYPSIGWGLVSISAAYLIIGYLLGLMVVLQYRS